MKHRIVSVGILIVAGFLFGCSGEKSTPAAEGAPAADPGKPADEKKITRPGGLFGVRDETDMRAKLYDIRITVEGFRAEHSRLPQTLDELKAELRDSPKSRKPLETGDLVFVPNLRDVNQILIYEKNPDARGFRLVFRGNGVTDKLSAEDWEREKPK